jgi:membrane protease YdiL (CAAX protease family)
MGAGRLFDLWSGVDQPRAYSPGDAEALTAARLAVFLAVFQGATVLLTVIASNFVGRTGGVLLAFTWPRGGARTLVAAMLVLLVLAALYAVLVYNVDRKAFLQDIGPFAALMKSRTWWMLLAAAAIGAPLAEEMLFRGFLYGALRGSPLGPIGAALLTSVMWAALHVNYSDYGLLAITLIGFYLAYLRERTGTLLTPMFCHGCYNALIVVILASSSGNTFAVA